MGWTLTDDVGEFRARADGFLSADPVANTVTFTVTEALRERGTGLYASVRFGWWTEGGPVEGTLLWTGAYPPLLSAMPGRAARELAGELARRPEAVPGIAGSKPAVDAFAAAWTARTGAAHRVAKRQRLYRLGRLAPPGPAPEGAARIAGPGDRELLLEWFAGFNRDAGEPGEASPAQVDARIAGRRLALWEVAGRPVSMAGWTAVVAGMARVNAVYTPAEHRRRGYAAAATANATRGAMAEGADDVVLFTDLANPTSNGLYQRLGYRPVEDRAVLAFT